MKKIPLLLILTNCIFSFSQIQNDCDGHSIPLSGLPCNDDAYQLVFEDNFDGSSLNPSKWNIATSGTLSTDNHCEYNSGDNIQVSNGSCFIIAKHETVIRKYDPTQADNIILSD